MRATISAKEKELLRELDELNKQNLAALTRFLETINSNYEETNKLKRNIELITKKDEVLILEDYRKVGELETKLSELNKSTEGIAGECSHLNMEFLQQELKEVAEHSTKIKINLKK